MTNLNAPWSLHLDRDGTEDIALIQDSNSENLATSRPFWMPEGGDPVPPTLAAMRVMVSGPKLLEALKEIETHFQPLENAIATCIERSKDSDDRSYWIHELESLRANKQNALAAIAEATGRAA